MSQYNRTSMARTLMIVSKSLLRGWSGGAMVNFHCRGVLLIWIRLEQGPTALAVGASGCCLDSFTLVYHFPFLSPFLSGRRPDID